MNKSLRLLFIACMLMTGFLSRAQVIHFKETFDNIPGFAVPTPGFYPFPAGWRLRNVDNMTPHSEVAYINNAWVRRENLFTLTDSCAYSSSYGVPVRQADDWMWTPAITLPDRATALRWRARTSDPLYRDGYEVRIMVAPNEPTGGTGSIGNQVSASTVLFSTTGEDPNWITRTVSLESYAGKTVYIAYRNNSTDKFILFVDDVTVLEIPTIKATTQTNLTCNGANDGAITVDFTGATPPYTFAWSHSATAGKTLTGLSAGTYTINVTDALGEKNTRTFTITQPAPLLSSTSTTSLACQGAATGIAAVFPSGGTSPYTYLWSTGATTSQITGLAKGSYTCEITDSKGCSITKTLTINDGVAAPTVTGVQMPVSGIYKDGNTLNITVNFSTSVIVATTGGIPTLPVEMSSGTAQAKYFAGSGSNALTFQYKVAATDDDQDGVTLGNIELNGGDIRSVSSGCTINKAVPGAGTATGVLIVNKSPQLITFAQLPTKTYGDADFDAGASSDAALAVSYSSSNTNVAIIVNGKIHIVGAGTADITATQAGNDDYQEATQKIQTLTVNKKEITVSAKSADKIYGENDPSLVYTYAPELIGNDVFSGSLKRDAGENAGTYLINLNDVSLSNNYAITYEGATFTINKMPVTITADNQTKIYGDNDPELTYSIFPAPVNGDQPSGQLKRMPGEDVGDYYTIDQSSLKLSANYAITFKGAAFVIKQRTITVTAKTESKTYGETDPVFQYDHTPALIGNDAFTGEISREAGENAGTYTINQHTLSLSNNYTIDFTTADFIIKKKAVHITALPADKIYKQADPVFNFSVSPSLLSGDVFTGALSRNTGENAGTYEITAGSLSNSNYEIGFTGALFTIHKAPQTITWNQELLVGCNGVTYLTLNASSASGLPVNYTSNNTTVAVINGNQLTTPSAGSATITASQAGNENYLAATAISKDLSSRLLPTLIVKKWSDVVVFDNSSNEYKSWQWYKNDVAIPGATRQFYQENGPLNGTYLAEVVTTTGVSMKTCPVDIVAGVTPSALTVFPNPASTGQQVTVKTSFNATALEGARIEVANLQGNVLQTIPQVFEQTSVRMPMTAGLYIIRLRLANGGSTSISVVVK